MKPGYYAQNYVRLEVLIMLACSAGVLFLKLAIVILEFAGILSG